MPVYEMVVAFGMGVAFVLTFLAIKTDNDFAYVVGLALLILGTLLLTIWR